MPDSSYFEFESAMRSEVYKALSDVAFDMFVKKGWEDYVPDPDSQYQAMAQACDWFLDEFFDEELGGYDE